MTQSNTPQGQGPQNLQIKGGAAVVAPASAFPGGIPQNALIVVPVSKPTEELTQGLEKGAMAVTQEQMWELLGFNGPAVQVQDAEGRPLTIGLEDLLSGLRDNWSENKNDAQRGRIFAGELMKHRRFDEAQTVLSKVVAAGGGGEDWMALGVAQLEAGKLGEAEATLKGARNLLKDNPFPSLHLAKVLQEKGEMDEAQESIEHAISSKPTVVESWAMLFAHLRREKNEEAAIAAVEELAEAAPNKKTAAPYIAIQGIFSGSEETRPKALQWAQKAIERNGTDPAALVAYSALLGQTGKIDEIVTLLAPHEDKMVKDVRLAHNYFEALMQKRDVNRVTQLLNKLAASQVREVKQFAVERSRVVAQLLQKQQQQLPKSASGLVGPGGQPL